MTQIYQEPNLRQVQVSKFVTEWVDKASARSFITLLHGMQTRL